MSQNSSIQDRRYKIISGYKFFDLEDPKSLREIFQSFLKDRDIKGTILLSPEGINCNISALESEIKAFKDFLNLKLSSHSLIFKESSSWRQPFKRMQIQIRAEIISMGVKDIRPHQSTAPNLSPNLFKKWMDERREITILDTRNHYEIQRGKFKNAIDLQVRTFKEFAKKSESLSEDLKSKPLVMYCTGGIRCEKAAPYYQRLGFKEVYQLEGGILNYFKNVGGAHYEGECVVFDHRGAVHSDPENSETRQCFNCNAVLTAEELMSDSFVAFRSCPRCARPGTQVPQKDSKIRP